MSDFEKELLSLPDILQKEIDAGGDKDHLAAITHLRDCFYNYFSTSTKDNIAPDIQWIDPQFIANYSPAKNALADLKKNLFNTAGVKKLKEKLREAGAFGDRKKDFYLWNTSPYNWDDMSYQARPVDWISFGFLYELTKRLFSKLSKLFTLSNYEMPNDFLPGQYIALGNFTINAIPEGYVEPKANGKYDICINKMYYFINDSFNFEGNGDLSLWKLNKKNEAQANETSSSLLFNSVFRDFRRHGYGREFPVLSNLREIEDFEPYCLENQYEK